jgi:hypothetical protein
MNPEDFHRLVALEAALAEVVFDPVEVSDLALTAHRLEDTPATAVEDAREIKALLGL